MPWRLHKLRGTDVWARVDDGGALVAEGGRVDVVYKPGGKVYRAGARNLEAVPGAETLSDDKAAPGAPAEKKSAPVSQPVPRDAYIVYADGACSGNPGPCGIGVVLLDGKKREEISEYLGTGTNNIAELTAIIRALEVAPRDRTVVIHSDSGYALGLLGKGWKAKANQDLVERMRALARDFRDLRLVKVAGHAGIVENERADALAREAVARRR
jgi:ribonuclease HI